MALGLKTHWPNDRMLLRYITLAADTLSILGVAGYGWPRKAAFQDGQAIVERQRQFRNELIALDDECLLTAPRLVIVSDESQTVDGGLRSQL